MARDNTIKVKLDAGFRGRAKRRSTQTTSEALDLRAAFRSDGNRPREDVPARSTGRGGPAHRPGPPRGRIVILG